MSKGSLSGQWQQQLGAYLATDSMQTLASFLRQENAKGKQIFPPNEQLFAALNATPFENVKVVILGQDPYHGYGQAHGLSFSVPDGVPTPPSLLNIYKELTREYAIATPTSGNLSAWANQGVLLLNSVLTVENGRPGSHKDKGWEGFTDQVIQQLVNQRQGLVFMLWGAYAQAKGRIINSQHHCVLRAPHPSPLSAYRGFIGCGHFASANRYLQSRGIPPIDWRL